MSGTSGTEKGDKDEGKTVQRGSLQWENIPEDTTLTAATSIIPAVASQGFTVEEAVNRLMAIPRRLQVTMDIQITRREGSAKKDNEGKKDDVVLQVTTTAEPIKWVQKSDRWGKYWENAVTGKKKLKKPDEA